MTSAMLLEYEDNNVGEDEVCKGSKDQHGGSRTKRRRGRPATDSSWPFHVSKRWDWSPFNRHIYAGTMRLCKWIKAYGHYRASTH
jgi:hypothetical protein